MIYSVEYSVGRLTIASELGETDRRQMILGNTNVDGKTLERYIMATYEPSKHISLLSPRVAMNTITISTPGAGMPLQQKANHHTSAGEKTWASASVRREPELGAEGGMARGGRGRPVHDRSEL